MKEEHSSCLKRFLTNRIKILVKNLLTIILKIIRHTLQIIPSVKCISIDDNPLVSMMGDATVKLFDIALYSTITCEGAPKIRNYTRTEYRLKKKKRERVTQINAQRCNIIVFSIIFSKTLVMF